MTPRRFAIAPRSRLLASAIVASAIISSIPSSSARACSVCGCDPAAGTLGLDRPSASSLRLALENRYLAKESGAAEAAESERELRTLLRAQYAPIADLTLQLELPVFVFKRHLDAAGVQDDNGHGLADLQLSARYELLRVGMEARHVLAVLGGLKLPTGANDRHLPGEEPDEHLQLGTGTTDGSLGLSYAYGARPWTAFANVSARVTGTNSRGFKYGNALFGTAGARRAFLDSGKLVFSLEAQLRAAGKDRFEPGGLRIAGAFDDDSGGKIGYATASAAYAFTDNLMLRGVLQAPVITALNGTQTEHPVAYLTVSYDWAL